MARINFPEAFSAQQTLFSNLNAKHTADGATSDLKLYFTQQGINMSADAAAAAQALVHEQARSLHSKTEENFRELRDNHFDPQFSKFKGMVQFLKGLNRGNVHELGNWGVTVDNTSKIVYPGDFDGRLTLMKAFIQKHTTLGAASPLTPYLTKQGISITTMASELNSAANSHNAMKSAAQNAEDETALRNNLWNPVVERLRGSVDYLKNLNSNNPKALGDYGVVVDHSPRPPRLRTTTLKPGEQITNNSVTIGGTFTNIGTISLHLYRGKTTTGNPTIVPAKGQVGMMKGWSTITVVNPSTLVAGKFTVLTSDTN